MAPEKQTEPKKKVKRFRRTGPGSLGETMARWKVLASNTKAHLDEMQHMTADHAAFEELIAKIEASTAEQDILSSRASALTHLRQEDAARARAVRLRIVGHLQGRFGTDNEILREFGLKPRKRKVRPKPQGEPPPEEPEPPAAA